MKTLIVYRTHGDEIDVSRLNTHNIDMLCGNPRARDKGVRYTETDLNRSFGALSPTSYEELRAKALEPILEEYDFVLDIHSTTSGSPNAAIAVKDTPLVREYAKYLAPNYVYLPHDTSLISRAKNGLVLELGGHDEYDMYQHAIDNLMHETQAYDVRYWEVYGTYKKKSPICTTQWKNYDRVKKGDVVAVCNNAEIISEEEFHPFLWGENTYKDMYGWKMRSLQ